LKCGRSVCEAEWHNHKLIEALMCPKGYFMDVLWGHSNLMIA